jgi:hypothetical protein
MYLLLLALLAGEIEFKVEASPLPTTVYEYKIEKGELPHFEHLEDKKHVEPPLLPKLPCIRFYSKETEKQLAAGHGSCKNCIKGYKDCQDPRIKDKFNVVFRTDLPKEATGTPFLLWQDSKGGWRKEEGWLGIDYFLNKYEATEKSLLPKEAKPQKLTQKNPGPHENNSYIPRMSVSRFTWPGNTPNSLKRHLESSHGINTSGMSYSDMLYEHDKWHTIHGPR